MRVENWDWTEADKAIKGACMKRARKAAGVIAEDARRRCSAGTLSRPMYKTGPYAGQAWTARDAGQLKKSIRVVDRDTEKHGYAFLKYGNVRVYAGHFLAYYARIVEYSKPFMRTAVASTMQRVKDILENG